MFSFKREWINAVGIHEFDSRHPVRFRYLKFIIIFGAIFTILQITDLILTQHALRNPEIKELNPLYGQDWFVPLKLTMVLIIMFTMSNIPEKNYTLAKKAMTGMIFMYVFINMNNLYFLLSS